MGIACSSGVTGVSTRDVPIIRIVIRISAVTTSASANRRDAANFLGGRERRVVRVGQGQGRDRELVVMAECWCCGEKGER